MCAPLVSRLPNTIYPLPIYWGVIVLLQLQCNSSLSATFRLSLDAWWSS